MLFSNDYRFKWTQTSMEINYMTFKEGIHIANHISNCNKVFTTKIALLDTLENIKIAMEKGNLPSEFYKSVKEFMPETYRLDILADLYQFLNSESGGMWLEKKSQSNQGRGIKTIKDVNAYRENLLIKKDVDAFGHLEPDQPKDSTQILMDKL